MTSQFLFWGAGFAGIFGLVTAIAAVTGEGFQIAAPGTNKGVPLPHSWPYVGLFALVAAALYFASVRWDTPSFAALRARRRWLVPVIVALVIVPGTVMLLFLLMQ